MNKPNNLFSNKSFACYPLVLSLVLSQVLSGVPPERTGVTPTPRQAPWVVWLLWSHKRTFLLPKIFGIFPCKIKNSILCEVTCSRDEIEPMPGENEMNMKKNQKKN